MIDQLCPFCYVKRPEHQRNNFIGITRCANCHRSYSIYYANGKELMAKGMFDEAVTEYLKALKNFKNTAEIYIDLAEALNHLSVYNGEGAK